MALSLAIYLLRYHTAKNRKEQDPDRYKEVTDAEKTIVAEKEDASSVTETEAEDASDSNDTEDVKKKSEYEDVCFICRRPESKAGKMFKLPNNITVCSDCMHKTMDTVSQFDYMGMLNNPSMMDDLCLLYTSPSPRDTR